MGFYEKRICKKILVITQIFKIIKKMAKCKICKLEFAKNASILEEMRDSGAKEAAEYFSGYCLLAIN